MSAKFQLVEDPVEVVPPVPQAKQPALNAVSIQMMSLALSALGQRAMVALGQCFTLLTVASGFYLWYLTPEPTDRQIVSLTIYACFVLAINVIVRKR